MNEILDRKYSYLSNFFKTAIEQNRLFHSLIFYGSNNLIQYALALEIARQLNCLEDRREDCQCQNCRWIRDNKHPAVMTISKIDNKTDSSKTVISEEQINIVLDTLINSSDYHRVFIFCDAQMKSLSSSEKIQYEEYNQAGFCPSQANDEKKWYPTGINTGCFSTVAANAMLKSIEEPPSNVTFIFLTNDKNDLLQTIVSRSQAFYVADKKSIEYDTQFFAKYFSDYPVFNIQHALDFALCLLNYQTEKELEPKYILDCLQYYLIELAKNNTNNRELLAVIRKDMEKLQNCKKMSDSYIKEQNIYEDLAFYFAKR